MTVAVKNASGENSISPLRTHALLQELPPLFFTELVFPTKRGVHTDKHFLNPTPFLFQKHAAERIQRHGRPLRVRALPRGIQRLLGSARLRYRASRFLP